MNWTKFQTYGLAPDKAFEALCNQLFENWCKKEYSSSLTSFTVVNGAGGDGGVESYAQLSDGTMIGLQAKWFMSSISDSQFTQIKSSIITAITVRPQITRYIVCIPRDLSSQTQKKKNTEDQGWKTLVASIKASCPELSVELWTDFRLTQELQNAETAGIHRYWFLNSELSQECFSFALEKAKSSWLSTKYVPDLNVYGEITQTISSFVGDYHEKEELINAFSMYASLGKAYCDAAEKLISICREQHPDVAALLVEIQNQTAAAVCVCETIVAWLANETTRLPKIEWNCFAIDFEGLVNKLKESHLSFTHYFHTSEVTKVLERLSSFNYYSWQKDVQFLSNPHSILFLGDPGTGKTHGLGAFSEKVMAEGLHLPIIIQARSIKPAQAWRDIIIQTLGLGNTWNEDDLWQAMTSAVNRHSFSEQFIEKDIVTLPKVIILVDGLDESAPYECWIERIRQTDAITKKYPQVRFCFTSRPAAFSDPRKYVRVKRLNSSGDVPTYKLFDLYAEAYGVKVKNAGWVKHALSTPLSLKLFCEIHQGTSVDISNSAEISIARLWRAKIDLLESSFGTKCNIAQQNQYIFKTILIFARQFLGASRIEYDSLKASVQAELGVPSETAEQIISYLETSGVIHCFCEHGSGISPDIFFYYSGIQGYFDYATARDLIDKYLHPENINFSECAAVETDTLYCLAILSIQNFNYLITRNQSIDHVADDWEQEEIAFIALQNTNTETAIEFKPRVLEIMNQNANSLVTVVNQLVLPLSRNTQHPLGIQLLDDFLRSFESPAQRDVFWSSPEYIKGSFEDTWYKSDAIALSDEEYELTSDDQHNGLPVVYAWALSTVDNEKRKAYRDQLMRWAQMVPEDYFSLFLRMEATNDPQIRSDLFAILMCLVHDTANLEIVRNVSAWIIDNVLRHIETVKNRDISIRYYSLAIVERALSLGLLDRDSISDHLPPYSGKDYHINLNVSALSGTRMGGYSAISYDLARYVLVDHFSYFFDGYRHQESKQCEKLISRIAIDQPDFSGISFEQLIISAAYAFIVDNGWNEIDFYHYDKDNPVGNTGIDVAIRRTHHAATHGACSRVMTVCEKYIWQARSYISGFLCDHLLFGNDQIQVCDYGLVDDFIIPLQELTQFDPNDIPKNRPWHIPAPESVLRGSESKSAEEVIMSIKDAPDINWRDWICINNSDHKYSICADSLISINQYSCFFSPAGVETCLFINTVIMPTKEVARFRNKLQKDKARAERVMNPSDWDGGVEAECYITPKEICWFPWKKRLDSYRCEEFPDMHISSAVDRCSYNYPEYGDVHYQLPAALIRCLLGISDSDGYQFFDNEKMIRAEYALSGEPWRTQQNNLLVDSCIIEHLAHKGLSLVWIMKEVRRETRGACERFGDFYAEKVKTSIGYFEEKSFICTEIESGDVFSCRQNNGELRHSFP